MNTRRLLVLVLALAPAVLRAQGSRGQALGQLWDIAPPSAAVPAAATFAAPVRFVPNPVTRYGLIVNGDNEERHLGNVEAFAAVMSGRYGVAEANLIVLTSQRKDSGGSWVEQGKDQRATKGNVEMALEALAKKADFNDDIIIYTTGHGDSPAKDSQTLVLEGDPDISAAEFAGKLSGFGGALLTYIGDQCYSGAFAQAVTSKGWNAVALSAADSCHVTYCEHFTPALLKAFDDSANDSDPKDGKVSEWEAFKAARQNMKDKTGKVKCPTHGEHDLPYPEPQYLTSTKP